MNNKDFFNIKKKVLIIGEFSRDVWVYGDVPRLNPESPTPIFIEKRREKNIGMAGNVSQHFGNLGIDCVFIHQDEEITKTRYVDEKSNYILLRVDDDGDIQSAPPLFDFKKYEFVIISDYCKGFLNENYIDYVVNHAQLAGIRVYIDTKKILGRFSYNAWVKINEKEYNDNLKNNAYINKDKTIVTLGKDGIKYLGTGEIIKPEREVEVRDSVGAGDTTMVFFSLYYYKTNDLIYSIKMANYYAGIACSFKGVKSDFDINF